MRLSLVTKDGIPGIINTDVYFFLYVFGPLTLLNLARLGPYSARTCAHTVAKSSQEMGAGDNIWLCKINVMYTQKILTFVSLCEFPQALQPVSAWHLHG